MADAGIIPEASSRELMHPLERDQRDLAVSHVRPLDQSELRHLIDADVAHAFTGANALDRIITSGSDAFARYRGDRSMLTDELSRRPRIDFLALCYMGKIPNHLQAGAVTFDLAETYFLARLNRFCQALEAAIAKPVSFTIAVEDSFFDTHIFRYETTRGPMTLRRVRAELNRFGFDHVHASDLSDFLSEDFVSVFETCVGAAGAPDDAEMSARFQRTFELAYPTGSFAAAIAQYSDPDGRRAITRWAEGCTERYMAFFEARNRTAFWERNGQFMRATDSERASVVQVNFGIGRVSVPHGVAVLDNGGRVRCEYYYDLAATRARGGGVVTRVIEADGAHVAFE